MDFKTCRSHSMVWIMDMNVLQCIFICVYKLLCYTLYVLKSFLIHARTHAYTNIHTYICMYDNNCRWLLGNREPLQGTSRSGRKMMIQTCRMDLQMLSRDDRSLGQGRPRLLHEMHIARSVRNHQVHEAHILCKVKFWAPTLGTRDHGGRC